MSPAAATEGKEAPVVEQVSAYSTEFAEWKGVIRGRRYVLREVPIGKFDDIEKQATDKVPNEDGTGFVEKFDANRRSRLLLRASIAEVEPKLPEDGIAGLGTRVVVALNTIVNELHYGDPDKGALKQEIELSKKAEEDGPKGKG